MAFQKVVDTAEIDIIYTLNQTTVQNVFYASLAGGYVLADLVSLAAAIDLEVHNSWKGNQPVEAVYVRTEVRGLAVENDLLAIDNTNTGVGLIATEPTPNNVTFAVKKLSGLTGRSARGRTYWIGIPRNQLKSTNENEVSATYAANVVVSVDAIRTAIIGAALWSPVLVSRFAGGVARSEGKTFPWVDTVNINERVDTQRGRLPQP